MSTNTFVVYTVLTGDYHNGLVNPFPDGCEGFDKICFTDNLSLDAHGWTLLPLQGCGLDARRESRRPKLLPHRYLPEYEWSLYIDNTIKFKQNPWEMFQRAKTENYKHFCFRHPWRNCLYDEAEIIIKYGFDDERRVREQMDHYRQMGYPPKAGLVTNTVLLRQHNDPDVIRQGEAWYEHVLRYSRRDQLSFNFCARLLQFQYGTFDGEITDNAFVLWGAEDLPRRIPSAFDDECYAWLNPEVALSGLSPRQHYLRFGAEKNLPYMKRVWELERLANKYKTDKGNIYYNAHDYAPIYEQHFEPIREQPLKILEIGLLRHDIQARTPNGPYDDVPSLFMWREYFPNAELIGFDIADFSKAPAIPNCKIVRGDMGNPDDLLSLLELNDDCKPFDIIIDDASHASHHQQIALGTLFPYLKPGGLYIIEDLNYQPPTLEKPESPKTKTLLQSIKWRQPMEHSFLTKEQLTYLIDHVGGIEFYDGFGRNLGGIGQDDLVILKKVERKPVHGWKNTRAYRGLRRLLAFS
jgi:hypothetical protein